MTGHWKITDERLIRESIDKVLDRLDKWLDERLKYSRHTFVVVSPLAEGADRLVAKAVLDWPGAKPGYEPYLEAVFPFPVEAYMADFDKAGSTDEFVTLKSRARSSRVLSGTLGRATAFLNAGRYVVNNCDVLIAIWDGQPSQKAGGPPRFCNMQRISNNPIS